MHKKNKIIFLIFFFTLIPLKSLFSQTDESVQVKSFVQNFYNQYVHALNTGKPLNPILKKALESNLYADLQNLYQKTEIFEEKTGEVLLGGDLIVNGNDLQDQYKVSQVKKMDHFYKVLVIGSYKNTDQNKTLLSIEVMKINQQYKISNIIYPDPLSPDDKDLVSLIKAKLKETQKK